MSGKDLPYPPFDNLQDRVAWYRGNKYVFHKLKLKKNIKFKFYIN